MESNETSLVRTEQVTSAIERFKDKLSNRKRTGVGSVLLLDCSGSMRSVLPSGETRIDGLRALVPDLRERFSFQQIVFASDACFSDPIPDAYGGTAMNAALTLASTVKPRHIIIVSDGSPTDASESEILLTVRELLPGVTIDTFFLGDPDSDGEVFMRRLSQLSFGKHGVTSNIKMLGAHIAGALTDGSPSSPTASGPIAL